MPKHLLRQRQIIVIVIAEVSIRWTIGLLGVVGIKYKAGRICVLCLLNDVVGMESNRQM